MKAAELMEYCREGCAEVLDAMYFTTVQRATEETAMRELRPGDFAFRLSFSGDVSGVFGVCLDYSTAYGLAANFLGEDSGELPNGEVGEVVGELANMLCGSVMSRVKSANKFVLSHPEATASLPDPGPYDTVILRMDTDAGAIVTWVGIEGAEGDA